LIAGCFGLHRLAVRRHRAHVARNELARAAADERELDVDDATDDHGSVGEQLDQLIWHANELLKIARASGDIRAALASIREARGLLDSAVRLKEMDASDLVGQGSGPGKILILPWNGRELPAESTFPSPEEWAVIRQQMEAAQRPDVGDAD